MNEKYITTNKNNTKSDKLQYISSNIIKYKSYNTETDIIVKYIINKIITNSFYKLYDNYLKNNLIISYNADYIKNQIYSLLRLNYINRDNYNDINSFKKYNFLIQTSYHLNSTK